MKTDIAASRSALERSFVKASRSNFSLASNLALRLQAFGQAFLNWASGKAEIQVRQTQTHAGDPIWHVYDPATDRLAYFQSEAEVRIWLEQRYCR